jgi:hypothetical protein
MLADFAVITRVREQGRVGPDEHPTVAVPSINLHAGRVHLRVQFVTLAHAQTVAKR